jgi:hypothetical protein
MNCHNALCSFERPRVDGGRQPAFCTAGRQCSRVAAAQLAQLFPLPHFPPYHRRSRPERNTWNFIPLEGVREATLPWVAKHNVAQVCGGAHDANPIRTGQLW